MQRPVPARTFVMVGVAVPHPVNVSSAVGPDMNRRKLIPFEVSANSYASRRSPRSIAGRSNLVHKWRRAQSPCEWETAAKMSRTGSIAKATGSSSGFAWGVRYLVVVSEGLAANPSLSVSLVVLPTYPGHPTRSILRLQNLTPTPTLEKKREAWSLRPQPRRMPTSRFSPKR